MRELTLAGVDRDEALTEAVDELYGSTRAQLLRGAALGGAAMLGALAAPPGARAQVSDTQILNFGLRFERLQATFYTEADEMGTIGRMPEVKRRWAETLGAHERAHVRILKKVLGRRAGPRPTFNFGDTTGSEAAFTRTAVAMEDLTVALLTGVAPLVRNRDVTAALFGLMTVEARHAAWARHIVRTAPVPASFDQPRTLASVSLAVRRTGFIVRKPKMSSRGGRGSPGDRGDRGRRAPWSRSSPPGSWRGRRHDRTPTGSPARRQLPALRVPAFRPGPATELGSTRSLSHWAPVRRAAVARAAPDPRAPAVAALATRTPEGTDGRSRARSGRTRRERCG